MVQPTVGPLALAHAGPMQEVEEGNKAVPKLAEPSETPAVLVSPLPESRLVALTDPNSLGAEKFRALATRFDHLRSQRELRSFQVTSSVIDEGKTLVAGNIAVTLAKYSGSKTLLVEGDLHRPTLANLFGLSELPRPESLVVQWGARTRQVRSPVEWNPTVVSSCWKTLRSALGYAAFGALSESLSPSCQPV